MHEPLALTQPSKQCFGACPVGLLASASEYYTFVPCSDLVVRRTHATELSRACAFLSWGNCFVQPIRHTFRWILPSFQRTSVVRKEHYGSSKIAFQYSKAGLAAPALFSNYMFEAKHSAAPSHLASKKVVPSPLVVRSQRFRT